MCHRTSSRAVPIRKFALVEKIMLTAGYWLWHRSPFLVTVLTKNCGSRLSREVEEHLQSFNVLDTRT